MNVRRPFLIALLALFLAGPRALATTVGLSSDAMNSIYAEQKQSEWCWAACIQMITNLYGADLTQDEVVARTYGPGVNRAGTLEVITANLNASGTTRRGRRYDIRSTMLDSDLLPAVLVAELSAGRPVLLGCEAGGSGHAVVCTAVTYQGDAGRPRISVLTVRDPWPSESNRTGSGRQTLRGDDLGPRVLEGWVIRIAVHEADGSIMPAPQGYVFNDADPTPQDALAATSNPFRFPRPPSPLVATNNPRRAARRDDDGTIRTPLVEAASGLVDLLQAFRTAR